MGTFEDRADGLTWTAWIWMSVALLLLFATFHSATGMLCIAMGFLGGATFYVLRRLALRFHLCQDFHIKMRRFHKSALAVEILNLERAIREGERRLTQLQNAQTLVKTAGAELPDDIDRTLKSLEKNITSGRLALEAKRKERTREIALGQARMIYGEVQRSASPLLRTVEEVPDEQSLGRPVESPGIIASISVIPAERPPEATITQGERT